MGCQSVLLRTAGIDPSCRPAAAVLALLGLPSVTASLLPGMPLVSPNSATEAGVLPAAYAAASSWRRPALRSCRNPPTELDCGEGSKGSPADKLNGELDQSSQEV
jgi:hypothetical protein